MIYYKDGKYHISNIKVHYKEETEGEIIKFVGQEGKEWWEEFAELWKDTFELIGFIKEEPTNEQLIRLEKVNDLGLPEGVSFVNEYVMDGKFEKRSENGAIIKVNRNHPIYILKLEEENEILQGGIVELTDSVYKSQTEIEGAIIELVGLLGGVE